MLVTLFLVYLVKRLCGRSRRPSRWRGRERQPAGPTSRGAIACPAPLFWGNSELKQAGSYFPQASSNTTCNGINHFSYGCSRFWLVTPGQCSFELVAILLGSELVRGCLVGPCQSVLAVLFGQAPVHTASKLARASVARPGRCGARAPDHSAQERKEHVGHLVDIPVLLPQSSRKVPQLDACLAVLWPSFLSTLYGGVLQSELLPIRQDRSLQPPRPNRSLDRGAIIT